MKSLLILISCFFSLHSMQAQERDFYLRLSDAALAITQNKVIYKPAYVVIPYPNGDVPANTGVCTDVVIRSYRKLGIDLQKEVHEDMKSNFSKYPSKRLWGLNKTDTNIDHRRVPNLQTFFVRRGQLLSITDIADNYLPGDIVTWDLPNGLKHIGIVVATKSADKKRNLIVHNIGRGQVVEDCFFAWKLTGHYRYKK